LLSFSLYSINEWFDQKLRTNPRSGTKNMFSPANGEPLNGEPVSLALSNPQPRFLQSPDPEQERFRMTEWFVLIRLL